MGEGSDKHVWKEVWQPRNDQENQGNDKWRCGGHQVDGRQAKILL